MDKVKIELELKEIETINNLIKSRVNELRVKMSNDPDKAGELRHIIRYYKQIVKSIDEQTK